MNAHRIATTLQENGTLTLHDLPFAAGASVDVIVLETNGSSKTNGAVADLSTPCAKEAEEENWAEALAREGDELCQIHGYGDAPANFAVTWKQEKGRRIMERNSQP